MVLHISAILKKTIIYLDDFLEDISVDKRLMRGGARVERDDRVEHAFGQRGRSSCSPSPPANRHNKKYIL